MLNDGEPEIHVRPEVAKTGAERYVFIPAALASWLEFFQQQRTRHGMICHGNELWKIYSQIAHVAKIPWKKNALRKSFHTYHDALAGALDETAEEAGNSAGMIRRYYRKPISRARSTAKEWFSLGTWAFKDEIAAFLHAQKDGQISAPKAA